ncbi:MAG: hypothetical protein PHY73_08845 [Candidatus Omnitrophica bacterium]|nr:hypothetical protein [Candidatus Omnitrophota bacterium]
MEENKKNETEDAQNLHPGKLEIGKIVFVGCLVLLLLFFLVFERPSKLICNTCKNGKLETKAVLVCFQFIKIPFSNYRLPYSIVKRTLCRCKNCGKGSWIKLNEVEKKFTFSNKWVNGADFSCPFCNGIMKAQMHADRECAADWYYQCDSCKQKLTLIHCFDQPISWAESFFKGIDLE